MRKINKMTILDVCDDVFIEIMMFCSYEEIVKYRLVSKAFHFRVSNEMLWKRICCKDNYHIVEKEVGDSKTYFYDLFMSSYPKEMEIHRVINKAAPFSCRSVQTFASVLMKDINVMSEKEIRKYASKFRNPEVVSYLKYEKDDPIYLLLGLFNFGCNYVDTVLIKHLKVWDGKEHYKKFKDDPFKALPDGALTDCGEWLKKVTYTFLPVGDKNSKYKNEWDEEYGYFHGNDYFESWKEIDFDKFNLQFEEMIGRWEWVFSTTFKMEKISETSRRSKDLDEDELRTFAELKKKYLNDIEIIKEGYLGCDSFKRNKPRYFECHHCKTHMDLERDCCIVAVDEFSVKLYWNVQLRCYG